MKSALIFQGKLIEISPTAFPVSPEMQWVDVADDVTTGTHQYNGVSVVPIPPKPLAEVKANKLASLTASRDTTIATLPPVTVAGKQYPATPGYREIIANLARRSAAGKPIPATLRGADGVPVTLTVALLGQIDDALAGAVNAQWDKWGTKFDAAQAATTVDAVTAITW